MAYFHSGFDQDSKLLAKSGAEVYTFILTHSPAFTLMDIFRLSLPKLSLMFTCRSMGFNPFKKDFGVCHGDDLNYLFPMSPPGFPNAVVTQTQKEVQQRLLDLVSSFAVSSKPTFSGLSEDFWKPVDANIGIYLDLGVDLQMERNAELSRQMEFWKQIREKYSHLKLSEEPVIAFYKKIAIER